MKNISWTITFTLLFFSTSLIFGQNKKVKLETFEFEIPEGMKNYPSSDVLAKLVLGRDLFITIDDNMDKMLGLSKKNPNGVSKEIFKFAFDTKFGKIKEQYKGYDATKKRTGKLKNLNYTAQNFTCKATKTEEAFLEYRVMEIGGKYYEFIVTGKRHLAKKHQSVIMSFWNGIQKN